MKQFRPYRRKNRVLPTSRPGYFSLCLSCRFLSILLILCLFTACQQDADQSSLNTPVPLASDDEAGTTLPTVTTNSTEEATSTPTIEPTATLIPSPTPTSTPTSTPEPPKEITICLGAEPVSLYLYDDTSPAATAIRHALYENLYTSLGYEYQAQGLAKIPSLADGDAVINAVEVKRGDLIVTLGGTATELIEGVFVRNAAGEVVSFAGEPIMMPQLVVDFTFKPLIWADGTPVTAADSVYSFKLNADPITPASKFKTERTAGYEAVGDLTVRWTGLPGFQDPEYFTNVWTPLPQHQLAGLDARQLITAEESARHPLSNGPFVLEDWVLGDHMTLVANPNYYRQAQNLPHIDHITITFHPDGDALTAVCDIITQDAITLEQASSLTDDNLVPAFQSSGVFEHIAFGINSYGNYGDARDEKSRPDWFQTPEMRRALAACIDRQRLVDELTFGKGSLMPAYIPADHPLFPADTSSITYDPAAANAQLDALGYVDTDGDGLRQDVSSGLPFSITLGTDNSSAVRPRLIQIVQENLRACGLDVGLYDLPNAEWFADGPVGPLFGREFDLGEFAWRVGIRPACQLWLTRNIPGPEVEGFGGWSAVNVTGWSNEAYDAACQAALIALPGTPNYVENHQAALRIFMDEMPIVPLFAHAKAAVTTPRILNFHLDVTQPSELWNLAELDVALTD